MEEHNSDVMATSYMYNDKNMQYNLYLSLSIVFLLTTDCYF